MTRGERALFSLELWNPVLEQSLSLPEGSLKGPKSLC